MHLVYSSNLYIHHSTWRPVSLLCLSQCSSMFHYWHRCYKDCECLSLLHPIDIFQLTPLSLVAFVSLYVPSETVFFLAFSQSSCTELPFASSCLAVRPSVSWNSVSIKFRVRTFLVISVGIFRFWLKSYKTRQLERRCAWICGYAFCDLSL